MMSLDRPIDKKSIAVEAKLRGAAARWQVYADNAVATTQARYCQEIASLFLAGADEISRLRACQQEIRE